MSISISFGILANQNVDNIIQSIKKQNIKEYEIIIVGNPEIFSKDEKVVNIYCHECETKNWITQKKNIITQYAQYQWVVMLKDYILLERNWYLGLCKFISENECDIVMNKIINNRKGRCIDWVWNNPNLKEGRNVNYSVENHPGMFVPGAFLCAKKELLTKHSFSEKIVGLNRQSDVEWSMRVLKTAVYKFNPYSVCRIFTQRGFKYRIFRQNCQCKMCK